MSSGAVRTSQKASTGSASGAFDHNDFGSASGSASNENGTTNSGTEFHTVGTLLAAIATCLSDALRILMFADKRQWGPDEFEQTRVLEESLDEAKKDFQEMAPLVHGQFYYENDRTPESLLELNTLLRKHQFLAQNFRDWARQGGPINPVWTRDTAHLRADLHRAQCRAARRIFSAEQEGSRCLGAFQVYRQLKRRRLGGSEGGGEGGRLPWQGQQFQGGRGQVGDGVGAGRGGGMGSGGGLPPGVSLTAGAGRGEGGGEEEGSNGGGRRASLEALVPYCNAVGRFQRLRDSPDAAFICNFCEGYIVWSDLARIPSERSPLPPTAVTGYPHWQARGLSSETGEDKTVVFAPLAIANHLPPEYGAWQAALVCPFCEEDTYVDEGEDSGELRYVQDDGGFPDLEAFREHLEWYHTALPVPPISSLASALPAAASNCSVM